MAGNPDRKAFFDSIRQSLFGGHLRASQVEGLSAILDGCRDLTRQQTAYVLATCFHETGTLMQPVREGFAKSDAAAIRAVTTLYEQGRIKTNYALPDPVTGKSYYGRGYVQLTWKTNYRRAGAELGLPLEDEPDLALNASISCKILVKGMQEGWFTGKKLNDYIALDSADYRNARKIINGLDKATVIADYAKKFEKALMA